MGLGAQVHRKRALEEVGVALPARHELRAHRRRGPRVHDVGVADEPARLAPLLLLVARGRVGGRVDGEALFAGGDGSVPVHLAVLVDRVPDREGHAEEALAGDVPVAHKSLDPVLVAHLHEVGVPAQLLAAAKKQFLGREADEPLAVGDDLEGTGAVLPEFHRMGDRPGIANHVA